MAKEEDFQCYPLGLLTFIMRYILYFDHSLNKTTMRILKALCFTLSLLLAYHASSQSFASTDPTYKILVEAGEKALKEMKYDSCMYYYKQAFQIKQTSYLSTMRNCACAYSAKDETYLNEQLKITFDLNWAGSKQIFDNYPEFDYLRTTPFEDIINTKYQEYAKASGVDLELMEEFENILFEDQRYRREMNAVEKQFGWKSPQMDSLWQLQNKADSINTARITSFIDEFGYPGKSKVGPGQASTAFLVIQHADLEIQEKYLPIITKAADEGEVRWSSVALLVDRVNMRKGLPQIYGSQVSRHPEKELYYFARIENPKAVDSIRASIGMRPLQQYADNWDITWDPEQHIKINDEVDAIKAKEEKEKK